MGQMITLSYDIEPEDDSYVATCRELDISSHGDSVEDAVAHLESAIALYLNVVEEDGELEQIFRERGIRIEEAPEADHHDPGAPPPYTTTRRVPIGAQ